MVLHHPHFIDKMTEVEIIEMPKVTEPAHDLGLDESTVELKLFLMKQIFHTLIAYVNVGMECKHMCMYICTYVWLRLLTTISFPSHYPLSSLLSLLCFHPWLLFSYERPQYPTLEHSEEELTLWCCSPGL